MDFADVLHQSVLLRLARVGPLVQLEPALLRVGGGALSAKATAEDEKDGHRHHENFPPLLGLLRRGADVMGVASRYNGLHQVRVRLN